MAFKTIIFILFSFTFLQGADIEVTDVKYFLFSHKSKDSPLEIGHNLIENIAIHDIIDPTKPVKILCHGYVDDSNSFWIAPTKDAYLRVGQVNVISVDWGRYAHGLYRSSVKRAKPIGEHIAKLIIEINTIFGIDYSQFHLIGHSLGSHISGYAGNYIFELTGQKVGRITGLDPAGPSFNGNEANERLSPDDAEFVDAIHTDSTKAGYKISLAHADFYPNGGEFQNGCSVLSDCNHCRAPIYFAESIGSNDFLSWKCDSYEDFKNGECIINESAVMGDKCDTTASGDYFLKTNKESPFGMGNVFNN